MSIESILTDAKSKLTALLTFANGKTGAADTSIGDAIHTLADGYGGGSGFKSIHQIARIHEEAILGELFNPSSITPTTSAQTIIPSEQNKSYNFQEHPSLIDYAVVGYSLSRLDIAYNSLDIPKPYSTGCEWGGTSYVSVFENGSNYADQHNVSGAAGSYKYVNASGSNAMMTGSYGIYFTAPAFQIYASEQNKQTVYASYIQNISRPAISVRAHNTYMNPNSWNYIDWSVSRYIRDIVVFRIDKEEFLRSFIAVPDLLFRKRKQIDEIENYLKGE